MTDLQTRCLDTFPEWLRTLATDASDLAQVLTAQGTPESVRRYIAGGLNYLFKSLDLIPDGIEDLGFLDDAFVLRVASAFENEVKGWAASFVVPSFTRDAKNLVKLKSFIGAKLSL